MVRFFDMYREEANKAGYQSSNDQLVWSNSIYVAETDEKAMREAKPHLEALSNVFLKMCPHHLNCSPQHRSNSALLTT